MGLVKVSLMTCALAAACMAQAASARQDPPGVTVYSFDWQTRYRTERQDNFVTRRTGDLSQTDPLYRETLRRHRGVPARDPNRLEMPSPASTAPRRVPFGYESSLQLKNAGAKAIRAVEWEHVFYEDRDRRNELRRFKFRKKAELEPGEQKFVSQVVSTGERPKLPTRSRQSVEIRRIEYADGSAWERR